ncbi:MAG TPA: AAA family ATPase [Terriglobales bacterium]|nr:AAA family ATPase [Terriglobales bacterium]
MHIARVVIKNYRCLREFKLDLNAQLNIVVGDNECGKSTFLEAVYLALTGLLNGRPIQGELHPHLFNADVVAEYLAALLAKKPVPPPSILIELYFTDDPELSRRKGTNNSQREDAPGVKLLIGFAEEYKAEYASYISDPSVVKAVPVEYYTAHLRDFADNEILSRSVAVKASFIDASTMRNNVAASRYIIDIVKDSLTKKERVDLALSYRIMKDEFLKGDKVTAINATLAKKKGFISDKALSVSLDTSSRASWETGIMPHLDAIPMPLVGKGEQNSIKIKLAMDASEESHVFLVEEPENHLSFANLNALVKDMSERRGARQLLVTTHSSFVMNKLDVGSVWLLANGKSTTLSALSADTRRYFLKLPGHDTLRLILAKRAILVEGPSDELIVTKAFHMSHGVMPLEAGVDVITVGSLAFKRFLEIANVLGVRVDVVTDNDGDTASLKAKYAGYLFDADGSIRIQFDEDEAAGTLEPQLLKANGREAVNAILGEAFADDRALLKIMGDNKTECALKFFEAKTPWKVPGYIARAIA